MTAAKWFYKQNPLVQILLLLIPIVNWLTEIRIRGTIFMREKSLFHLMFVLSAIFSFGFLGWIDLICLLVFNRLLFVRKTK